MTALNAALVAAVVSLSGCTAVGYQGEPMNNETAEEVQDSLLHAYLHESFTRSGDVRWCTDPQPPYLACGRPGYNVPIPLPQNATIRSLSVEMRWEQVGPFAEHVEIILHLDDLEAETYEEGILARVTGPAPLILKLDDLSVTKGADERLSMLVNPEADRGPITFYGAPTDVEYTYWANLTISDVDGVAALDAR